jgi:hypothetical protein
MARKLRKPALADDKLTVKLPPLSFTVLRLG